MEDKVQDKKDEQFLEDCISYKRGWTKDSKYCLSCNKIQYNRCRKGTLEHLKECLCTDIQIKEFKANKKGYTWK